jgi:acyl-CoA thioester hydrolase
MISSNPKERKIRPTVGVHEFEVPFHDVDSLGVVWHGHYLKYCECARTKLLEELGLGGEISRTFPYTWVVIESKLRHIAPLVFGQKARVEARLVDVNYRVHVAYRITDSLTNQKICKGYTMLATLDENRALLLQTPQDLLDYLTMKLPD